MSDNTASYGINFEDGVSGPSEQAAGALDRLRSAMERDTAALTAMRKAMANLKAGGSETTAQVGKLAATMEATRARIAKAQGAYLDLGGGMRKATQNAAAFRERMQGLQDQARMIPGPVGQAIGLFERFSKVVGGGWIAAGILGMAAAVVAFTAATMKLTGSLYDYVVATQNARRTEGLRLEGLTRQWSAVAMTYGLAKMKGTELQAGIDRIAARTALSREETAKYGAQLYTMGLRGKQWASALEGMTMKAAVQGDAQAQMFASWAAGTALMGGSVDRLTDRVKSRLGGIAKAQMLDATVQSRKLQESFDSMFRTVDIEPLLKAKASLFSMFSQASASGRYLSELLGRIVQPLISAVTRAIPIVKAFFQNLIISALHAEIAYLRMSNALAQAFDAAAWRKRFDAWKGPLGAIADLVGAIGLVMLSRMMPQALAALVPITLNAWGAAGAFLAMGGNAIASLRAIATSAWAAVPGLAAMAWNAAVIAAPFVLAAVTIYTLIRVFRLLKQAWDELDFGLFWKQIKSDWDSISWGDMGKAILDGIASAFAHPAELIKSIKGLGAQVIDVFTGMFEISSPSKVFARLGAELPAGMVIGIDRGKRDVHESTAELAMPQPVAMQPAAAAVAAVAGGGKRGGGGVTISGGIHVHAADTSSARSLAADIKRELESVLQGVALQMGAV
jgi:hypothetical protein